jgi:hypothetical protein
MRKNRESSSHQRFLIHLFISNFRSRSRTRSNYSGRSYSRSRSPYQRSSSQYQQTPPQQPRSQAPTTPISKQQTLFSSSILDHISFQEFNGNGLLAFMNFCKREYASEDTEFEDAYFILNSKRIRVDILKNKTAEWYVQKGVQDGTAEILAKKYPK